MAEGLSWRKQVIKRVCLTETVIVVQVKLSIPFTLRQQYDDCRLSGFADGLPSGTIESFGSDVMPGGCLYCGCQYLAKEVFADQTCRYRATFRNK